MEHITVIIPLPEKVSPEFVGNKPKNDLSIPIESREWSKGPVLSNPLAREVLVDTYAYFISLCSHLYWQEGVLPKEIPNRLTESFTTTTGIRMRVAKVSSYCAVPVELNDAIWGCALECESGSGIIDLIKALTSKLESKKEGVQH